MDKLAIGATILALCLNYYPYSGSEPLDAMGATILALYLNYYGFAGGADVGLYKFVYKSCC